MRYHTKIVCTLGPASNRKDTITKMAKAGMSIARINFSHGDHKSHQELINTVRTVNEECHYNIKILQDLEGYRIRVGQLNRSIELIKHQLIYLIMAKEQEDVAIPLDTEFDITELKKGRHVYIDDGRIDLKVLAHTDKGIKMEVMNGGLLKSRKGVNIPRLRLKENILTEKDKRDIEFGVKNKVDYMAQSFVRNKKDILRVIELVKSRCPDCKILAKIENEQGVSNVDSIMNTCDGIMVARGDLGVSLPIYQIPIIQKDIIQRCNEKKKTVITATQMLESMTESVRPTRAEVSDVANAIMDGTDYVMLSGETAAGAYPVKSVRMMRQIIEYTEQHI